MVGVPAGKYTRLRFQVGDLRVHTVRPMSIHNLYESITVNGEVGSAHLALRRPQEVARLVCRPDQRLRLRIVGWRPRGEQHEQRAQALATGGDRRTSVLGQDRAMAGGSLAQALLDPRQQRRDVRSAGAHELGRLGPERHDLAAHAGLWPTWIAMMPPAVRT